MFNSLYIVREAFKIFDRNKDGMISLQELKKVTDILGTVLSKEEVDDFMKEADKVRWKYFKTIPMILFPLQDGDGTLDIDEFVRCLLQYG